MRGPYDVLVVGAGAVGLSIAYELARRGASVAVIEKEAEAGFGVSKGHAGVIHVLQLPLGSLKSRLAIYGNKMYDKWAAELGVKPWRLPALLVASSPLQLPLVLLLYPFLRAYYGRRGFAISLVSGRELREREPNLNALGAIRVDGYAVADPFELTYRLYEAAKEMGAEFYFNVEAELLEESEEGVKVKSSAGAFSSRYAVNAAGLYSDLLAGERLKPKRGVMVVFDRLQAKSIVAPISLSQLVRAETKGGGIIPTAWGHTIWGPGFSEGDKEDTAVYPQDVMALLSRFGSLVRRKGRLLKGYAGVRPASPARDFMMFYSPRKRIVHLVGIESPGFTALPALALMVLKMLQRSGLSLGAPRLPRPPKPLTRELLAAGKEVRGEKGKILCHCMRVSVGDVLEAMERGASTLDGVMFRTKLGMGPCQGQHCMGRAAALLLKLRGEVTKSGGNSWIAR
ncbi:MAG: FAD-dependent oxidoreductase [Acidilobaceae archaeon]|nr:FAD-dependent oxidoreductase [Acidilobaceae archaeon]MCX8166024.1 FAD-dependent oxidoreductase [Acidilobaceae archaeon]MDW7974665.1 FAD-dependent oxidoreductase [Sulfolobales archaeon]